MGLIVLVSTTVFVSLKLAGALDWSWWWVFSPAWGEIALVIALHALGLILSLPFEAVKARKRRKEHGF